MQKRRSEARGFTLIEVMFAFAILAALIVGLVSMQTMALRRASEGSLLITATQLARKKMIDCKYDLVDQNKGGGFGFSDYKSDGAFDEEGYPEFKWTCEAPYLKIPVPNLDAIGAKANESGGVSTDPIISMIGAVFGPLITAIGDCARELVTTVKWKFRGIEEELKITTHVIDREKFAQSVAAFPLPGALGGGGTGGTGGTQPQGTPPTGQPIGRPQT